MNLPQQRSQPDQGQFLGLMLAGAVIGVSVFGVAIAVFDEVRDRTGLHWSSDLLGLLAIFLLLSTAVTILCCCLLAYLIGLISRRAVANALVEQVSAREPASSPNWSLREAPPSVSEHTAYKMREPAARDRT